MKVYPICLPCFLNQVRKTAEVAGLSREKTIEIEREVAKFIWKDLEPEKSPGHNATFIHRIFKKMSGVHDPYGALKKEYNSLALKLEPVLKEKIYDKVEDKLAAAIKLAALGNVIDFGVPSEFDLEREINEFFKTPFAYFDEAILDRFLVSGKTVLYVADNAGEIVFDKFLVSELKNRGIKVILAVRGAPILNDATVEDAVSTGIADMVDELITTGKDYIGVDFEFASREFKEAWEKSYFVISKGQANFETLDGVSEKDIFFILKAKCKAVAKELSCNVGDLIFLYNKRLLEIKEEKSDEEA
jgi:uncharacterized protein with ATP-grasp and redox domains